ncbi:MAG TPA: hypothetical protein VI072_11215 [Polyangiaceae bacterium]
MNQGPQEQELPEISDEELDDEIARALESPDPSLSVHADAGNMDALEPDELEEMLPREAAARRRRLKP